MGLQMAQIKRSKALFENHEIGIESLYKVIQGEQVNIPEVLADLRAKSDSKQLFCTCGCGRNLVLVAPPVGTRKQHFRMLNNHSIKECEYVEESEKSIASKIILKCWMSDKLKKDILDTRVPVCDVTDSTRRFEYTILSKDDGIAACYCNYQVNLSPEKIRLLKSFDDSVKVFFFVDEKNYGSQNQYPEYLMEIQRVQGYCLFLNVIDRKEYEKAIVEIAFSYENEAGFWKEESVITDSLCNFAIVDKKLMHQDIAVDSIVNKRKEHIQEIVAKKKAKIVATEERKNKSLEGKITNVKQQQEDETQRRVAEFNEFKRTSDFDQSEYPIMWNGRHYKKCTKCGRIVPENYFPTRSNANKYLNKDICSECCRNRWL